MKKALKNIVLIILPFIMLGCGDDKDEPQMPEETNAEYYIKYEISASFPTVESIRFVKGEAKFSVNTDNGIKTFKGRSLSQTFGPFKKGFRATIAAERNNLSHTPDFSVQIYVCRGSEPFALKANKVGSDNVSISYTIDY